MQEEWKPKVGMVFDSQEDAWKFWVNYGGRVGFGARKEYSHKRKDGLPGACRFVCCKEGTRKQDKRDYKIQNPTPETRTDCKAMLGLRSMSGKLAVHIFVEEHNHILHFQETTHMLASQRKVSEVQCHEINLADDVGLKQKKSFDLMSKQVGGRANLGFTQVDQKNHLRKEKVDVSHVVEDPHLSTKQCYPEICRRLIRIATEACRSKETITFLSKVIDELEKYMLEFQNKQVSTTQANDCVSKVIEIASNHDCATHVKGFKKKEGRKGSKRMKGWLEHQLSKKNKKGSKCMKDNSSASQSQEPTMHSVHPTPLSIQGSTALVPVNLNANNGNAPDSVQDEGFVQAQATFQNDLGMLQVRIKQHEENLNQLSTQRSKLDDSLLNLLVTIGKFDSSNTPKISNGDKARPTGDEEVNEQILKLEKSAAGIFCQLKTRHGAQASNLQLTKYVVGIVATLGKVEDDNLSRLLSEFLGVEYMLAIVCRTYEDVKALEMYDNEGFINKCSGLHGLGASIGRALDGRFQVICLESLRPYPGKYVVGDPQRKLDILNPRLPSGESPAGFLGFAVNMINVDSSNLFCVTPSGYGLRETLFYNLFSRLQVYMTREEMIQALPCISDGALSLDGGMVRSCGVFSSGNREDVHVRFPRPETSMGPDRQNETEANEGYEIAEGKDSGGFKKGTSFVGHGKVQFQ